jgi:hypothetical protein
MGQGQSVQNESNSSSKTMGQGQSVPNEFDSDSIMADLQKYIRIRKPNSSGFGGPKKKTGNAQQSKPAEEASRPSNKRPPEHAVPAKSSKKPNNSGDELLGKFLANQSKMQAKALKLSEKEAADRVRKDAEDSERRRKKDEAEEAARATKLQIKATKNELLAATRRNRDEGSSNPQSLVPAHHHQQPSSTYNPVYPMGGYPMGYPMGYPPMYQNPQLGSAQESIEESEQAQETKKKKQRERMLAQEEKEREERLATLKGGYAMSILLTVLGEKYTMWLVGDGNDIMGSALVVSIIIPVLLAFYCANIVAFMSRNDDKSSNDDTSSNDDYTGMAVGVSVVLGLGNYALHKSNKKIVELLYIFITVLAVLVSLSYVSTFTTDLTIGRKFLNSASLGWYKYEPKRVGRLAQLEKALKETEAKIEELNAQLKSRQLVDKRALQRALNEAEVKRKQQEAQLSSTNAMNQEREEDDDDDDYTTENVVSALEIAQENCASIMQVLLEFDKEHIGVLGSFSASAMCLPHTAKDAVFGAMCRNLNDIKDQRLALTCIENAFATSSSSLHGLFIAFGDSDILSTLAPNATRNEFKLVSKHIGTTPVSITLNVRRDGYVRVLRLIEFMEHYELFAKNENDFTIVKEALNSNTLGEFTYGSTSRFDLLIKSLINHMLSSQAGAVEYIKRLTDNWTSSMTDGELTVSISENDKHGVKVAKLLITHISNHFATLKKSVPDHVKRSLKDKVRNLNLRLK